MLGENREPILKNQQEALEVVVDRKLISWAHKVADGRQVMQEVYAGTGRFFVPCENDGCSRHLNIGDQALLIKFKMRGRGDRVFCSVTCQRQNYLDTMARSGRGQARFNKLQGVC